MGAAIGLLAGAGLFCVWWSLWPHEPRNQLRASGWSERTADLLAQAGVASVTPTALLALSIGVGMFVFVVVAGATGAPAIAALFGAMAGLGPHTAVRGRARRRQAKLREVWPEVVDHLASGVRAGLALPEALAQLGDRGPEELREPFTRFAEDYRATGRFSQCLDVLKARLSDPVADRIVEALRITRDVGGTDLGRLLRTLSQFLRDDARTRGELEARQSWTVGAARLAAGAPWVVLALLSTRSEAAQAFNTPAGVAVLMGGAAACVVAYRMMLRIGRLPEDVRVLR